jgi:LPXTG-motif cell wall-anchored protein
VSVVVCTTIVCTLALAAPALAHVEFEPGTASAGEVVEFTLAVANEMSDEGTVKVQLHFPEGQEIALAALPDAPGWTTEVQGGDVGEPVTDVIWSRPSAPPENVELPITLGPLPPSAVRLQFQVLQTYSGGEVVNWIQDWPEGAPEPDRPGPILQVTGTASTTVAPSTTTTVAATTTLPATTTTTIAGAAAPASDDGDDANVWPIVIGVLVVVAIGGGAAYYFIRRRRAA